MLLEGVPLVHELDGDGEETEGQVLSLSGVQPLLQHNPAACFPI
ncbi:hypothetical protein [Chroococcidiopsis sp.]